MTVQHISQPSLCVKVTPAQPTSQRGHSAQWTVSEWATGGNLPDATVRLRATPASGGAPGFSFGCGNADGTSVCDLGAIDARSAPRQLQVRLTVPVTASNVTSVSLTVTGGAARLTRDPTASSAVSITAPPASASATHRNPTGTTHRNSTGTTPPDPVGAAQSPATTVPQPVVVTSPLPVGTLPSLQRADPTLS
ncbi:MAG: hypothetical protein ACRDNS_08135, partial [Trebonia sp.]